MTEEQVLHIYTAFKTIPAEAREWLTSKEVNNLIGEIKNQLVLSDDQELTLAFMLVRLAMQDIRPENFRQEAARELAVDNVLAERITNAVREKILSPIARPLQFAGVDITLLHYNAPTPAIPTPQKAQPPPPSSPPPAVARNKPFNTAPSFAPGTSAGKQDKPFILHEESPSSALPQPSFTFTPDTATTPRNQSAPPQVIIERVVHYNNLYTPLNQKGISAKEQKEKIRMPKSRWFS